MIVRAARLGASRSIDEREEPEAVAHLMKKNDEQVDLASGNQMVESHVEREVGAELSVNVVLSRILIGASEGVGKRGREQGVWNGRIGEITKAIDRACRAQNAGRQRIELRLHTDVHGALQKSTPLTSSFSEDVDALLAEGGARIASYRRGRCGLIKTFIGAVLIDNCERGGLRGPHGGQYEPRGCGQRGEFLFSLIKRHDESRYYRSFGTGVAGRAAPLVAEEPCWSMSVTHVNPIFPSGPTVAMATV